MWFVYILECTDGSLYTGITTDVERRFRQHCDGKAARYTRAHKPRKLVYSEVHATRSEALKREYAIKQLQPTEKAGLRGLSHSC